MHISRSVAATISGGAQDICVFELHVIVKETFIYQKETYICQKEAYARYASCVT